MKFFTAVESGIHNKKIFTALESITEKFSLLSNL